MLIERSGLPKHRALASFGENGSMHLFQMILAFAPDLLQYSNTALLLLQSFVWGHPRAESLLQKIPSSFDNVIEAANVEDKVNHIVPLNLLRSRFSSLFSSLRSC